MVERVRKAANKCSKYVHAKTAHEVKTDYKLDSVTKLCSNENPYAPFEAVKTAMINEIDAMNVYPEKNYSKLQMLLGDMYGLSSEWIGLGHGAGNVLEVVAKTFIDDGDEIIIPAITYNLYKEISIIMGGVPVFTPMTDDYKLDLNAIESAITAQTKLIFICNPNNPTGTIVDKEELTQLIMSLPSHVWVLLDEAYAEFATELPDSMGLIKQGYNLVCIRTFSKFYGLAGGRIGYVVANPDFINMYNTVSEPFNANRIGLAGAVAVLEYAMDDADFFWGKMLADRDKLSVMLEYFGCDVVPSHANFIFFDTFADANFICDFLAAKGFIIRPCNAWGLPSHIRLSIGTYDENVEFLAAFQEALMLIKAQDN